MRSERFPCGLARARPGRDGRARGRDAAGRARSPAAHAPAARAVGAPAAAALLLLACGEGVPDDAPAPAAAAGLPDVAGARGLVYRNVSGRPDKPTILEANGTGVALLDLGEDGDLDVVFGQGLADLGALVRGPGADLAVFANDGTGRFAPAAGPGLSGWWNGLATGDLDGDGDTDLVAGGFGDLVVCEQDAAGALEARAGGASGLAALFAGRPGARLVPGEPRAAGHAPDWFTSLALFDADRDGALDLYAGRYLELDPLAPPIGAPDEGGDASLAVPCTWKGHVVFCGPRGLVPQRDLLLRGDGRGGLRDASGEWLPGVAGFTLGVAPFDADMDGDTDLFVAADSSPNQLLVNEIATLGAFRDGAAGAGVALSPDGRAEAGMGVAVGDVNGDGLFDLAVTNFSDEPTQLYLAAARGFSCVTFRAGLGHLTRRSLAWGVHLVDLDGDGRLELFQANGHVYPQADEPGTGTRYGQPDALFRLTPEGRAEPFPLPSPSVLDAPVGTRGSAVGDLDGDGAPELILARIDAPAALGWNRIDPHAHRLLVRCLGPGPDAAPGAPPRTPPDGKGTRLIVVPEPAPGTAEHALLGEVQTARGYQSASSECLYLGLGASASYRSIRLLWPSGRVEDLPPGAADRRLVVREGAGIVSAEPLR